MAKKSAGILLYRLKKGPLEVFLVHPGGPFFIKKDDGAWTIPKGEFDAEEPLVAAKREFLEETGMEVNGNFITLAPIRQKSGKMVLGFALESDFDVSQLKSNTFEIEWPSRSGKMKTFPEIDRGEWFGVEQAKVKINAAQVALIEELLTNLGKP
ncbi:MAG: NUDIX domain-containing protein [Chitinophagaceae bacterium]